jgi:hypothetical protein
MAAMNKGNKLGMATSSEEQKDSERRILEDARSKCSLFPDGEIIISERPDLLIKTETDWLGVEVTQLLRLPMQIEAFHQEVRVLAERMYHASADTLQIFVNVSFLDDERCQRENPKGWSRLIDRKTGRKKDKMARSLVEFVVRHVRRGDFGTFSQREMDGQVGGDTLPTGFEVIAIWTGGPFFSWRSGESATMQLDAQQVKRHICATINKKNDDLKNYRPEAGKMPVWLLLYSGPSVSQSLWVPPDIVEWKFSFDFDKVLLFSANDVKVFEIHSSGPREKLSHAARRS